MSSQGRLLISTATGFPSDPVTAGMVTVLWVSGSDPKSGVNKMTQACGSAKALPSEGCWPPQCILTGADQNRLHLCLRMKLCVQCSGIVALGWVRGGEKDSYIFLPQVYFYSVCAGS